MNFGTGRPSVKVEGVGRAEAGRVIGVVLSEPVMAKSDPRVRLKRPIIRAAVRTRKAYREAKQSAFNSGAARVAQPQERWKHFRVHGMLEA